MDDSTSRQTLTMKRIVVLGAGAVGGSIGGMLCEAGHDITLIARGEHGVMMRRRGLSVRLPDRSFVVHPRCEAQCRDFDWRQGDVVLLATKLQDAEQALDDLVAAAGPDVPVVCAVNGIDGERWAAQRFATVLSMLVWLPASHLQPGEVLLHAEGCYGVLDTGPCRGKDAQRLCEQLCGGLRSVGFDAIVRPDIARWKLAKWITNLGGAAQALVVDGWQLVANAARAEGEAVLRRAQLERVPTHELIARVAGVRPAQVDGKYREGGSTWQSRARGQPLESHWIEGAMARFAAEHGVPAPINSALAEAASSQRLLRVAEVLAGSDPGS
jgi:2-dehydropantoate 2-reductase